jgi:hypothetical protein
MTERDRSVVETLKESLGKAFGGTVETEVSGELQGAGSLSESHSAVEAVIT